MASDAPPTYSQATGSSHHSSSSTSYNTSAANAGHTGSNGIPTAHRRSMEDQHRPLPKGWVRTFDPQTMHQFYVDTTADPPRSIWVHPYDDDTYLDSLPPAERERVSELSRQPSNADIVAEHTDEEDAVGAGGKGASGGGGGGSSHRHHEAELPPRPQQRSDKGKQSYGRKLKDKLTGTTHEEREAQRRERARREEEMYRRHLAMRQAMVRAEQTGQPQLLGKDRDGQDIYIQPSYGMRGVPNGYPGNATYLNPYGGGMYSRPGMPYGRPYGYGYGGGYGLPLAGGLLGGAVLGGLLF